MTKYHLQLIWTALGLLTLGILIKLASDGVAVAIGILSVLGALILVGFGVAITLLAGNMAARRDQASFINNAKENLGIILAMQRLMNAQNSQLLKQARQAPQLPATTEEVVDLVEVDESIFDVLED